GEPEWVYLSSQGGNSLPWHKTLEEYFNAHPKINLAFQPGTYQIELGKDKLAGIYKRTKVFICNKEEAQKILGTDENEVKKLLKQIGELGPEIIVITDGVKGAYIFSRGEALFMPPYPDVAPPLERTGAGDAFSSTFVACLCLGLEPREALKWAPVNAMSVVQYVGAREGLLSREKIEEFLKKAPTDYKAKLI
ncbi:MAG: PfkB family carbohydrate kinase, partial [Patescibacteria group bacterium]